MSIFELIAIYEATYNRPPESIDALLDFFQHQYIYNVININEYKAIYHYLHRQGAVSAHEDAALQL